VGVQPPQPSWGLMIKKRIMFYNNTKPDACLAPGFAVNNVACSAFNLLGNGLS
jgi:peptide/nickel transport system permease protein